MTENYKKCECGCGEYVKSLSARYIRGHSNRDPKVKEKKQKTCFKNYGVECPFQSTEVKEKSKEVCIKKYGVENISQSEIIKDKKLLTIIENFGGFGFSSDKIKCKINQSIFKKHGVDNISKNNKIKEKKKKLAQNKYNVDNVFQSSDIKKKIKKTLINNYGVENWAKSVEGKIFHRINTIQRIEDQRTNGEPLIPCVGYKERPFLNELQKYCKYKILRQDPSFRYIIGRFPDGYIKELKLFILFDESSHFVDKECTILNEASLQESKDYKSIQDHNLFRVSEKDWLENPQLIINRFEDIINEHY